MLNTCTVLLFLLINLFGNPIPQSSLSLDINLREQTEIIDLSTTIDGQEYACSVIINPSATRGGPAILFLHGYGECGTDNEKQLAVGLPKHAMGNPDQWPFVLIVPQKPIFNSEWDEHEDAVLQMLESAAEQGLYNPDRLAITGLSQGGHGTIAFASAHPDQFVAVAPVCGYLRPFFDEDRQRQIHPEATPETPEFIEAAKKLASLPTWFWHGGADSVVPVAESRALHKALKNLDADCKYTELPGIDHNSWDDAYTNEELIAWFKEHLIE